MSQDEEKEIQTPETEEDKTSENESEEVKEEVKSDDKDLKSALAQKEHFREKFEKAQAEIENLKKDVLEKKEDKPAPPNEATDDGLSKTVKKIEFAQINKDLSPDAVAEIADYANSKGITLDEAKDSPVMKAYVKAIKDEQESGDAIPEGGRSPKTKNEKSMADMSKDERKAYIKKTYGLR